MKIEKVAVIMGGPSTEREVSFNTGNAIVAALKEKGYEVVGIDLEPARIVEQLREVKADVVFNAIHGIYGEDGMLQGVLEMLGIPYTGSGLTASAVTMDKAMSKRIFVAEGIPTAKFTIYHKSEPVGLEQKILANYSLPVVLKSISQGSSIGVEIVEKQADLPQAIKNTFKYSDSIIVEEFIEGKELTAAVWGDEEPTAFPVIEIAPHSGKYDYQSKYTKGATNYIVPAPIDEQTTALIQEIAVKVFKIVGCRGVARVDLMLDAQNRPYVLEVNTIPGMTATSLVPKAAAAAGISFADLCERLLLMAIK